MEGQRVRKLVALSLVLCLGLAPQVGAYNRATHQEIVDLSYEIMRAVSLGGTLGGSSITARPPGIPAAQWTMFLSDINAAVPKLRSLGTDLGQPFFGPTCILPGLGNVGGSFWTGNLGGLPGAPQLNYDSGPADAECGVNPNWAPQGVYAATNSGSDRTGMALGFYSAAVDEEFDDTHLWHKPNNAGGLGAVKDGLNDVHTFVLGALIAPFFCLAQWFQGKECSLSDIQQVANDANILDDLDGLTPGFGDISGSTFVGMWHHINMGFWADNEFDDREGMLLENGGWLGIPDVAELGAWIAADFLGLSLNHGKSLGPHRYTVATSADFHAATDPRSKGEWQFSTVAHTAMEPLDNLAFFGWEEFKNPGNPARRLGWPLHALGDAAAPHHVIGSFAWGHRAFEDATQNLWDELLFRNAPTGSAARLQRTQARRILVQAFTWWRMIQDWRALTGLSNDIPIRDMVTQLAQDTFDHSSQKMTTDAWPFVAGISALPTGGVVGVYEAWPGALELGRPLIENSAAAKLAFLTAAAEVF